MHLDDMARNLEVIFVLLFIENYEEEIEARHNRSRDVHIVTQRLSPIVPTTQRVCCSQDRGARIKSGVNASFGNRDGLLLHSLVNGNLVLDIHLVELIDAADAMVCKHQRTSLNAKLACLVVFAYRGGQAGRIRGLT